jgi:hypothetical protein
VFYIDILWGPGVGAEAAPHCLLPHQFHRDVGADCALHASRLRTAQVWGSSNLNVLCFREELEVGGRGGAETLWFVKTGSALVQQLNAVEGQNCRTGIAYCEAGSRLLLNQ